MVALSLTVSGVGVALVTGGSGFVGRALCAVLRERGVEVRVAARHPVEGPWDTFVAVDLRERPLPTSAFTGIDTVFHLAGKAHVTTVHDREHWAVTVDGTRRVLEGAERAGVGRFVFMSSSKAVGENGQTIVDEEFDHPPETAYGRAKQKAEQLVLESGARSGMHTAVLRPCLVYGPGWKGNLARMFRAVQRRRFPPLPDNGNRRSLVHVADVARAAILSAETDAAAARVFFLSDGEAYSTRRIYEAMCYALGEDVPQWEVPLWLLNGLARVGDWAGGRGRRKVPFDSDALNRLLGSAEYDASRARRELRWTPLCTLEQALPEIVAEAGVRSSAALTG